MGRTAIGWTHGPNGEPGFTFNPWIGCFEISPACDHCYAREYANRFNLAEWGPTTPRRRTSAANWKLPLKWNAEAKRLGVRFRVFCASLADVFDNAVPVDWRAELASLIAQTPYLDWLILTKRIGNVLPMCANDELLLDMISNRVWLGATICNQEEADRDIWKLLEIPSRVKFLSMEPLLGQVDLRSVRWKRSDHYVDVLRRGYWTPGPLTGPSRQPGDPYGHFVNHSDMEGIDWVIVGAESGGAHARPMHPDWARSLRDQCEAAETPYFFKQWGNWAPWEQLPATVAAALTAHGKEFAFDDGTKVEFFRKDIAGRILDGFEYNGSPKIETVEV